jgi:hypothetical protein
VHNRPPCYTCQGAILFASPVGLAGNDVTVYNVMRRDSEFCGVGCTGARRGNHEKFWIRRLRGAQLVAAVDAQQRALERVLDRSITRMRVSHRSGSLPTQRTTVHYRGDGGLFFESRGRS